jgi:predicted patatin/cPLA2 family phospholipase
MAISLEAEMIGKTSSNGEAQYAAAPGRRKVALALQGGGSHGAFTWGVLDPPARRRNNRNHRRDGN